MLLWCQFFAEVVFLHLHSLSPELVEQLDLFIMQLQLINTCIHTHRMYNFCYVCTYTLCIKLFFFSCIKLLPVYHHTRNVCGHLVTQVGPTLAAGLKDLEN